MKQKKTKNYLKSISLSFGYLVLGNTAIDHIPSELVRILPIVNQTAQKDIIFNKSIPNSQERDQETHLTTSIGTWMLHLSAIFCIASSSATKAFLWERAQKNHPRQKGKKKKNPRIRGTAPGRGRRTGRGQQRGGGLTVSGEAGAARRRWRKRRWGRAGGGGRGSCQRSWWPGSGSASPPRQGRRRSRWSWRRSGWGRGWRRRWPRWRGGRRYRRWRTNFAGRDPSGWVPQGSGG